MLSMKISSHPILCMGSLVSIFSRMLETKGEIYPGKVSFWVLRTSISLAMELDMKGQCPKIIS